MQRDPWHTTTATSSSSSNGASFAWQYVTLYTACAYYCVTVLHTQQEASNPCKQGIELNLSTKKASLSQCISSGCNSISHLLSPAVQSCSLLCRENTRRWQSVLWYADRTCSTAFEQFMHSPPKLGLSRDPAGQAASGVELMLRLVMGGALKGKVLASAGSAARP